MGKRDNAAGRVDEWDEPRESATRDGAAGPPTLEPAAPAAPAARPATPAQPGWRLMVRDAPGWIWLISCLSLASLCGMVLVVVLLVVALK